MNFQLESLTWQLKLNVGEVCRGSQPSISEYHACISLPDWGGMKNKKYNNFFQRIFYRKITLSQFFCELIMKRIILAILKVQGEKITF